MTTDVPYYWKYLNIRTHQAFVNQTKISYRKIIYKQVLCSYPILLIYKYKVIFGETGKFGANTNIISKLFQINLVFASMNDSRLCFQYFLYTSYPQTFSLGLNPSSLSYIQLINIHVYYFALFLSQSLLNGRGVGLASRCLFSKQQDFNQTFLWNQQVLEI